MKRHITVILAILVLLAICISLGLTVMAICANADIDYELDEKLFNGAISSNTATFMAYNRDGELVEVWKDSLGGRKTWANLEDISPNLINAFISAEDREYYSHRGVNIRRTICALANHFIRVRSSFGASTITQQVIKNISGDNEHTISRKFNEVLRAIHLEAIRDKDEILEVYLNIVPMSGNIYGVREAALSYFDKEPAELSLSEAATIAGITNAPSKYNPYTHREECLAKRNNVLYAMFDNGVISEREYKNAIAEPLTISKNTAGPRTVSSWFVETATEDIINDLVVSHGISRSAARLMLYGGTSVILTMNPEIQYIMEEYFENGENLPSAVNDGLQLSMVVEDSHTGALLGVIGRAGQKCGNKLFNLATAPHMPASTLKPLALYAPLIEREIISWSTIIEDAPISYIERDGELTPYPKNSPDRYDGKITVSDAIKRSKNTAALALYESLVPYDIFCNLRDDFGFSTLVSSEKRSDGGTVTDIAPAPLALGQLSQGVSLLELTNAYTAFPNYGVIHNRRSYYGVLSADGSVLLENTDNEKRILKPTTATIMNMLLAGVVEDGTARSIRLKEVVDTAGKTGTSGGDRDRLFIGYTPYYVAGIWCGYDGESKPIGSVDKSHLAIWDEVMVRIHENVALARGEQVLAFSYNDAEMHQFCKTSGMLANGSCIDENCAEWGYFSKDTAPTEICPYH